MNQCHMQARAIVGQALDTSPARTWPKCKGRRSACPTIAAVAGVLSIFIIGCATHSASRPEKRTDEAAALHWLQLLDDGDYEEAFEWEAQDFRIYRTQGQFVRLMQARRAPFGRTFSRNFIGAARAEKFVGAPEGHYESVLFKTAFEHKNPTAERVVLIKQAIGWRVIDYRIF